MAVSWRRIAVPAAALGVLVPAALGGYSLLSDSPDSGPGASGTRATGSPGPDTVSGADDAAAAPEGGAVVAKPSGTPTGPNRSVAVKLSSYDAAGKRAVLKASGGKSVRSGDVIAAAPSRKAPAGALFKVRTVTGSQDGEVRVTTAPATLSELLGDQKVNRRTALRGDELSVKPLSSGVTVRKPSDGGSPGAEDGGGATAPSQGTSPTPSAGASEIPAGDASPTPAPSASDSGAHTQLGSRAARTAPHGPLPSAAAKGLGALRLGVNVPLPKGVQATDRSPARLAGDITFRPELIFQYDRRGGLSLLPQRAAVGLGGSYSYGWQVHGKVRGTADTGKVSVPLAAVTGRHVFWVGPVPVVVSTEVTFNYRFTAGGRIVLDADQRTTGSFAVGARYDRENGWRALREADQRTKGGTPRVQGAATATARVGVHAEVFLYDTAGVGGDLSVYLTGRAAAGTGGGAPAWALSAGYDLKTELMLQLKIFGIRIADLRTTPFALHGERKLFGRGKLPAGRV
ncbi:hypothetical protein [Streptomyces cucumeris]|uniref:hypothetical protein n=1 Tax=Streptomyces cucumeris TaxID=2962890 RepID=UPI003D70DFED